MSRTFHRRRLRGACLLACFLACSVRGDVVLTGLSAEQDSGVDVRLIGAYENLPTHGFVPIRIELRNGSGRERSWKFQFQVNSHHYASFTHQYTWDVSLGNGENRTFEIMVPMEGRYNPSYTHPSMMVTAFGYGLRGQASYYGTSTHSGMPALGLMGMTTSLSTDHFGPLQAELNARGKDLRAATLTPASMSSDWRAFLGFESVWMTDKDWSDLGAPARAALTTWVAQGGDLVIAAPAGRLVEGLPEGWYNGERLEYGLGAVHVPDLRQFTERRSEVAALIEALNQGGMPERFDQLYGPSWMLHAASTASGLEAALLLLVLFAFALVVGPVNLIWLAGRRRRWRLFVTTPLISMAASLVLGAAILLQDGVGGEGVRVGLALLLPEQRQMMLFQEQSSQSGLLLSRDFPLSGEVAMHRVDGSPGQQRKNVYVQRDDRAAGGDWFSSRDTQAHVLQTAVPSRARFELLNPAEVAAGTAPPRLRSTLERDLASLYYTDARQKVWFAKDVRVGESKTLEPASGKQSVGGWWREHILESGLRVHPDLLRLQSRPGHVVAVARTGQGEFIPTLPSVRWEDRKQVYIGPCVASEEGPRS